MSPPNGVSSSRTRKIAPEIDNAQTSIVAMTVALAGAKIPKLMKIIASQKVSTARNGSGIEPPLCSRSNHRARPISRPSRSASALRGALSLVPWRERLDLVIEALGVGLRRELRRSSMVRWPRPLERLPNGVANLLASLPCLRTVMSHEAVEDDDVRRHLDEVASLDVVGGLRRGEQQAHDARRHRRDEPDPQLDDVLRVRAQMMLGQDGAEPQAEQCAAEGAGEHGQPHGQGARDQRLVEDHSSIICSRRLR